MNLRTRGIHWQLLQLQIHDVEAPPFRRYHDMYNYLGILRIWNWTIPNKRMVYRDWNVFLYHPDLPCILGRLHDSDCFWHQVFDCSCNNFLGRRRRCKYLSLKIKPWKGDALVSKKLSTQMWMKDDDRHIMACTRSGLSISNNDSNTMLVRFMDGCVVERWSQLFFNSRCRVIPYWGCWGGLGRAILHHWLHCEEPHFERP